MLKTTMCIVEQTENSGFGASTRMHFLYLIKDEETPIYAGKSYDPIDRIHQHLGLSGRYGNYFRDDLGNVYFDEKPASQDWAVILYTIQDCIDMVMKHIKPKIPWYNEQIYLDPSRLDGAIGFAEESLILENRPCLNRMMNSNSTPLPSHYKSARPDSSSSQFLDL